MGWRLGGVIAVAALLGSASCGRSEGSGGMAAVGGAGEGGEGAKPDGGSEPSVQAGGLEAEGGGSGQGAAAGPTFSEAARLMLAAQCERHERCGLAFDYSQIPGGCAAALDGAWQAASEYIDPLVAQGTFVYDPAAALACVEARREARCDDPRGDFPAACELALDGTLAVGEVCSSTVECVGDALCQGCPGRCVALVGVMEPCGDGVGCNPGLFCIDGACVEGATEGQSCNPATSVYCSGGQPCVGYDATTDGRCSAFQIVVDGAVCGRDAGLLCEDGTACVAVAYQEGLVERCQERSASGGRCWSGLQDTCPVGEYCPLEGLHFQGIFTATCLPLARAGERCYAARGCEAGALCLQGLCVADKHLGDDCRATIECVSGVCSGGQCVAEDVCVIEDAEPPLLRDPPRPPEECPTTSPGILLGGFDTASAIAAWWPYPESNSPTWAQEGFSCPGALRLMAQLSETNQFVEVVHSFASNEDWSEFERLHFWVKLETPGVAAVEGLVNVEAFVSTTDGRLAHRVDASWLRDGEWHELVVKLAPPRSVAIDSYGVHLWLRDPAGQELPELDLTVDDIWLE